MRLAGRDGRLTQQKWFDSPADYAAPPPALVKCYTGGYTTVFGGWDDSLKAALAKVGPGSVELNDGMAGYLKDPAADAEGFKTGEMPMIWLSKRKIREASTCGRRARRGGGLTKENKRARCSRPRRTSRRACRG